MSLHIKRLFNDEILTIIHFFMNQNLSTDLTPHFPYREQSTENEHNVNLSDRKTNQFNFFPVIW